VALTTSMDALAKEAVANILKGTKSNILKATKSNILKASCS